MATFHEGELAVQRRAGVERTAAAVGRNITSSIPSEFGEFLRRQPFAVAASEDEAGRVWASLLVGGVGFATVLDDRHVALAVEPFAPPGARVGLLAIEFDTRSRLRLNGVAEPTESGMTMTIDEAFGNCPKYIQRRLPVERLEPPAESAPRPGPALDERQRALVSQADTFFIASLHSQRSAAPTPRIAAAAPDSSACPPTARACASRTTAAIACSRRSATSRSTRVPASCSWTGSPGRRSR